MKNVLICNQKGGVGKSLIADELAFGFERAGVPCNFYDLDSQGGTIHKTAQRPDAAVSVIDTPGALQAEIGRWMAEADVIVIPTRTTSRDIEPLLRMQEIAAKNAPGTPVVYVLNGWNRWRASSDFLSWFKAQKHTGKATVVTLPQSEAFVQAGATGMSVAIYAKRSPAAGSVTELFETVRKLAGV